MAGDWIKIEHALPDKPEVMEMATALGIDSDAIVGKLIRVWTWFDNHTADGNAPVTVRALLDRYTGVTNFVTTMESVGWMEQVNDRLIVRHFDRHNGQTAKSRANTNRRVAKARSCNGDSVTNVTPAALQKPLPEKRRKDYVNTPLTPLRGDALGADAILIEKTKSLRGTWNASPLLSAKESRAFAKNREILAGFSDEDWQTLAEFFREKLPEGSSLYQPRILARFLSDAGEVLGHARDWMSKRRSRRSTSEPERKERQHIPRQELEEIFGKKATA
jgi:hypothetical protein